MASGFFYQCENCGEVTEAKNKFDPNPGDHFIILCKTCKIKSNNIDACFGLEKPWTFIKGFKLVEESN